MLLKTNEEMGEVGPAAHQASQIEPSAMFVPGYAEVVDAREQFGCND
jgi:hypothetical protein